MFSELVIIPPIRGADPGGEASARCDLQIKIKTETAAGLLSLLPYLQSVAERPLDPAPAGDGERGSGGTR